MTSVVSGGRGKPSCKGPLMNITTNYLRSDCLKESIFFSGNKLLVYTLCVFDSRVPVLAPCLLCETISGCLYCPRRQQPVG